MAQRNLDGKSRSADGQAVDPTDEEIEQLLRRRIDPVQVFKDHQHRLLLREGNELLLQCFERLLLPASRVVLNASVAPGRQQQQVGQQRTSCSAAEVSAMSASSLSSFAAGVSSRPNPGGTLEQIDNREQRAVLMVGRAEKVQIGVPLRIEQIPERHREA